MNGTLHWGRVKAVHESHRDEAALRLEDHTPNGGYTSLLDAAHRADMDLVNVSDGKTVAVAVVSDDGDVEAFHPTGRDVFPIVAVEVDSEPDAGFTVAFDKAYDLSSDGFPITETAATKAVDDAYTWGVDPQQYDEMGRVGILVVDEDREYVDTHLTG